MCSATFRQQRRRTTMTTRNEDDDDENNGKYCALFCFTSTYCIIPNLTHTVFSSRSHDSARPVAAAIGISMMLPSSSRFRVSPHQLAPREQLASQFSPRSLPHSSPRSLASLGLLQQPLEFPPMFPECRSIHIVPTDMPSF